MKMQGPIGTKPSDGPLVGIFACHLAGITLGRNKTIHGPPDRAWSRLNPVPDLTHAADIKLNNGLWLRLGPEE